MKELRATQNYGPRWGVREIRKEGVGVQKRLKFPLLFICFAMFGPLFGCHRVGFCSDGRPLTRLKLILVAVVRKSVHNASHGSSKLTILLLGDAIAMACRLPASNRFNKALV